MQAEEIDKIEGSSSSSTIASSKNRPATALSKPYNNSEIKFTGYNSVSRHRGGGLVAAQNNAVS